MSRESFSLFRGELLGAKMYTALKALSIAEEAHEGIMRKDGVTPYIEHPMKVASILYDLGITDEEVIATALLHDVIEDCEDNQIKLKIYTEFCASIGLAVTAVSKKKEYNNDEYYAEIKKYPNAILVKLADRCHNLSTLYNFTGEKKAKYIKETEDYIYPLIKYAQHTYYEYGSVLRTLDLWIETVVNNLKPYMM